MATFSPSTIPGCFCWFDATDTSYFTLTSTLVTQWRDKSGNGRDLAQANSNNSPTLISSSQLVNFRHTGNQFLSFTAATTSNMFTSSFSFFIAHQRLPLPTGISAHGVLFGNTASFTNGFTTLFYENNTSIQWRNGPIGAQTINTGTFSNGEPPRIVAGEANTRFNNLYMNGSLLYSNQNAGYITSWATGQIGSNGFGNDRFTGNIFEIIFYQPAVPYKYRLLIEGYLAAKYNIQNVLTFNHPYFTLVPTMTTYSNISTVSCNFDPRNISTCSLWLDAEDETTFSGPSSNLISNWVDKTGNIRDGRQTTQSNMPRYVSSSFLYFNSSSNLFMNILNASTLVRQGMYTGFAVSQRQNNTNPNPILGGFGANRLQLFYTTNLLTYNSINSSTFSAYASNEPFRLTSFSIGLGQNQLYVNGALSGFSNTDTPLANWDIPYMGRNSNSYYTGYISELLFFNTPMTGLGSYNQRMIEGYLAWKWGLVGLLPTSHPFYNSPPTNANIQPLILLSTTHVVLANNTFARSLLTLPKANLNGRRIVTIKDQVGAFDSNPLYISTSEGDGFEDGTSQRIMREKFGFIKLESDGNSTWNILGGTNMDTFRISSLTIKGNNTISTASLAAGTIFTSSVQFVNLVTQTIDSIYSQSTNIFFNSTIINSDFFNRPSSFFQTSNSFLPSSLIRLGGLQIWYDGSDSNTMTFSSGTQFVTRINDKSGNNRFGCNAMAAVGNRLPAFQSTPISCLSFNGISSLLFVQNATNLLTPNNFSFFFVEQRTGSNNNEGPIIGNSNPEFNTFRNQYFIQWSNANTFVMGASNNSGPAINFTNTPTFSGIIETPRLWSCYVFSNAGAPQNGTQLRLYSRVVGSNTAVSINILDKFSNVTIGGGWTLGNGPALFYQGNICEILCFKPALQSNTAAQVEGYLAWKWGINTLLPTTHPFYSGPP